MAMLVDLSYCGEAFETSQAWQCGACDAVNDEEAPDCDICGDERLALHQGSGSVGQRRPPGVVQEEAPPVHRVQL
jgi:hypothetical protein